MLSRELIEAHASVRQDFPNLESPFSTILTGHYFSPKSNRHFRPGPDALTCNLAVKILPESHNSIFFFGRRLVLGPATRRPGLFERLVTAHLSGRWCGRFSNRVEKRSFGFFLLFGTHSICLLPTLAITETKDQYYTKHRRVC